MLNFIKGIKMIRVIIYIVLILGVSSMFLNADYLDKFKFEKVSSNVYVMHGPLSLPNEENKGFMNNPSVIIGDKGVIVIDPGSTLYVGNLVLTELEKLTKKPIVAIFNTHIHGDHWLANETIAKKYPDVKIYAHPNMIKRAKSGRGKYWVDLMFEMTNGISSKINPLYPNNPTKHLQIMNIGSESFKIHSPTQNAHTNTDIMIEHINSKTMFLGDNDFLGTIGQFGSTSSIFGAIKSLRYSKSLNLRTFVPGHGQTGSFEKSVQPFLSYMEKLKQIVQVGFDDDLESYEIKDEAIKQLKEYSSWRNFKKNIGVNVIRMYSEIEEKALEE